MKWFRLKKSSIWDFSLEGIKARRYGIIFKIKDYTEGWNNKHVGWFIIVEDTKTGEVYNSLWGNIWFEDKSQAMKWCEDFTGFKQENAGV